MFLRTPARLKVCGGLRFPARFLGLENPPLRGSSPAGLEPL